VAAVELEEGVLCVAACCSVLQYVALWLLLSSRKVCCALQCVAVHCSTLHWFPSYGSVAAVELEEGMLCVATCRSVF